MLLVSEFEQSGYWFRRALDLERDKKGSTAVTNVVAGSLHKALNEVPEDQREVWLGHLAEFDRELYEIANKFRQLNAKRRNVDSGFDDVPF